MRAGQRAGAPPVRGRHEAAGFVVEPALLGEAEARRRVLAHWQVGSRLSRLPDGAWLLTLAHPVSVRAEHAPGLVVVPAGADRRLVVWRGGQALELDVAALPPIDLTPWVDVAALPVRLLQPVEAVEPVAPTIAAPEPPLTSLRQVAGVAGNGESGEGGGRGWGSGPGWRRGRGSGRDDEPLGRLARTAGLLVVAAALMLLGLTVAGVTGWHLDRSAPTVAATTAAPPAPPTPEPTPTVAVTVPSEQAPAADPSQPLLGNDTPRRSGGFPPMALVWGGLLLLAFVRALANRETPRTARPARGAGAAGGSPSSPSRRPWAGLMRRLVASPLGFAVRSRHERYLYRLTQAFEAADYDTALRRAIALQGTGGRGGLSVRLPRPRLGALSPSYGGPDPATSLAASLSMQQYLRELYGQAAEMLEKQGQVEQAAFVRADLLGNVYDAVQLLERHRNHRVAASLAEGRGLEAALVVKLWWQAGDRRRAVDMARLRGGLDEAARRLENVDPAEALQLRREWVTRLLEVGDLPSAVEVARVTPALRPLVEPHLAAGVAAGGASGAALLAYLVCVHPSPAAVQAAEALLRSDDDALAPARAAFVAALARTDGEDAAVDRRLTAAALRRLVTEPPLLAGLGEVEVTRTGHRLRGRADHLLAIDAPPVPRPSAPGAGLRIDAFLEPGPHSVADAVTLPAGVLVALGGAGVRLLATDGRVRARWSTSADRMVVADHGFAVLLLSYGERTIEVHRLDLRTRQVRRWTTLPAVAVADSFDAAHLVVTGRDGLTVVDTTATGTRLRTVWRELSDGASVLGLQRTQGAMTVLVQGDSVGVDGVPQLWTWALPGMTLRSRSRVPLVESGVPPRAVAIGAGTGLLSWHPEDQAVRLWSALGALVHTYSATGVAGIASAGPYLALLREVEDARGGPSVPAVEVIRHTPRQNLWEGPRFSPTDPSSVVSLPGAGAVSLRHHGDVLTVHDHAGRVVAVDVRTQRVVANLLMRAT